jgi:hypothetical protein
VTRPNPDKMSWEADGETAVEVPTNESQQRLKASAKPELRWDDDAHTAVAPIDAIIPAEAYRDPPPENKPVASASSSEATAPVLDSDAEPEAVFELGLRREVSPARAPPAAPRWIVAPQLPTGIAAVGGDAVPRPKRRSGRRWLLLALLIVAFYAGSYFVVSVTQKLDRDAATGRPDAPRLSVGDACGEVLDDTWSKFEELAPEFDRR